MTDNIMFIPFIILLFAEAGALVYLIMAWKLARKEAEKAKITKVETNFYDHEETFPDCTVQVLTNTATGDVSVGWWKNGDET